MSAHREAIQGAAIGRRIRQWAKERAFQHQAAAVPAVEPVNAFSLSEAAQLGGCFDREHADRVSAMRRLIEAMKQAFLFAFDRHVIEVACVRCGELLQFTHHAAPEVITAELLGHKCKAKATATL